MRNFVQPMAVLAVPLLTALLQSHLVVLAISSLQYTSCDWLVFQIFTTLCSSKWYSWGSCSVHAGLFVTLWNSTADSFRSGSSIKAKFSSWWVRDIPFSFWITNQTSSIVKQDGQKICCFSTSCYNWLRPIFSTGWYWNTWFEGKYMD